MRVRGATAPRMSEVRTGCFAQHAGSGAEREALRAVHLVRVVHLVRCCTICQAISLGLGLGEGFFCPLRREGRAAISMRESLDYTYTDTSAISQVAMGSNLTPKRS